MEPYFLFEEQCKTVFNNKRLLQQAFIHRSYINENKDSGLEHNERLEFLGDAVLELVVTDFLFKNYPDISEGRLTAYRSALVRTESISAAARKMGMNELLMLSKGEARDQGKARDYILANTFESFVGAVYLDQGYEAAKTIIDKQLIPNISEIIKDGLWRDAKSYVQERAQEIYSQTPRYELVSAEGPDHDKHFVMAIYFGDKKIAEGEGNSKQSAQQSAAQNALKKEGWDEE
jgi:ribonuclease III